MKRDERSYCRVLRACLAVAACLFAAAPGTTARAEPALDRVLSGVNVGGSGKCTLLDIGFNLRVRYVSHFPTVKGQELRILLRAIDGPRAAAEMLSRREALRPPEIKNASIRAIFFEAGNAAGPALVVQFATPVYYDVAQGGDFQSIVVAVSGSKPSTACKPISPSRNLGGWSTSVSRSNGDRVAMSPVRAHHPRKGEATPEQVKRAAAALDEGRAAMRKGQYDKAIAIFTKVLNMPETPFSADAQEYLGVAYRKAGATDKARAEFEDYLAHYPSSEGAERVRQRLAVIITATADASELRESPRSKAAVDDGTRTWTVSGSASQFYIRDDSFRTLRDPSLPLDINADLDTHRVHQNDLLSTLDAIATWSGGGTKSKLRFSGTEEHSFSDEDDIISVAALYLQSSVADWGFEGRIGRQTLNSGGVLGRFDGVYASYAPNELFRFGAVAGSPVLRRSDDPFLDERYFYGGSIDIGQLYGGLDFSVFAVEQRDRSILDRRAVGAEFRYNSASISSFGTLDYDIHYNELNAAVLNGTYTFADKSTLFAAYEYRKSPYLSTWTALQGQNYPTLYEMLRNTTLQQVEQYAVDRTAAFTTASVGFSHPINNTFQVSADATVTNLEGTIMSGGVEAITGTGNEYFYSAQLIGNNVFANDDLMIASVRFADLALSNYYVLDLSARYPLIDNLKINPRLRLGYRTGDVDDLVEYSVLPSVLVDYYFTRDMSLEFEVGADWRTSKQNGIEETSTELFFTVGYRYDFYADGQVNNQSRITPYGVGATAQQR